MTASLRILHALEKNRLETGSAVQLFDAAHGLRARGHRVQVVTRPGGDLAAACEDAGIDCLSLPLRHPADLGSARRLRQLLRASHNDIVHVHKGCSHSIALIAATGLGHRPVVVVNRGVLFPLDIFNRWKFRHPRVGAVVCVADAVREVVTRTARLPPARVHTVYAGTDCTRFDPARGNRESVRRELGLGHRHTLVGQVSVRDWKGWHDLLVAFAVIASRRPAARLLFVGCEPPAERIKVERAAAAHGVTDCVLTLPYRRDMSDVLVACDVVVDASWAGTGITGTIREAMAMEGAVVATNCGGNGGLVTDGEAGLVVPARDPGALSSAIDRLIEDEGLRTRLGGAARRRVMDHFSSERRLDRLETLYASLVAARDPADSRPEPTRWSHEADRAENPGQACRGGRRASR